MNNNTLKMSIKNLTEEYIQLIGKRLDLVNDRHKLEEYIYGYGEIEDYSYEDFIQREQETRDEFDKVELEIQLVDNQSKIITGQMNLLKPQTDVSGL